jgi:hypothetical protein
MLHILPYPVDLLWAKSTGVLSCTPSLEVMMDQVVWGIFWKVFKRSHGPPTRSVGSTDRSVGLLVGQTHLSGTSVSLVGGDPGVPMSHNTPIISSFSGQSISQLRLTPEVFFLAPPS